MVLFHPPRRRLSPDTRRPSARAQVVGELGAEEVGPLHRGLEINIHLSPGLANENFVAEALGNLAADRLQRERYEPLQWQILRVELPQTHFFRLAIRHPERALDLGLTHALKNALDELSALSVEDLSRRFHDAQAKGLSPVPLRHVHETPDLWQDDFWRHLG